MREIKGKRVYAVEEIRQMIKDGFDTSFAEYLDVAPDRVKRIIENMLANEHASSEGRATYDIVKFNDYEIDFISNRRKLRTCRKNNLR